VALDSSTTVTQAFAALNDNLDWVVDPAKARLWLEAALWLQANRADSTKQGVSLNWESLAEDIREARRYVRATTSNAVRKRSPFTRARPRTR